MTPQDFLESVVEQEPRREYCRLTDGEQIVSFECFKQTYLEFFKYLFYKLRLLEANRGSGAKVCDGKRGWLWV